MKRLRAESTNCVEDIFQSVAIWESLGGWEERQQKRLCQVFPRRIFWNLSAIGLKIEVELQNQIICNPTTHLITTKP